MVTPVCSSIFDFFSLATVRVALLYPDFALYCLHRPLETCHDLCIQWIRKILHGPKYIIYWELLDGSMILRSCGHAGF